MNERKPKWNAEEIIAVHNPISSEIYAANLRELARILYRFYGKREVTDKFNFESPNVIEINPKEVA